MPFDNIDAAGISRTLSQIADQPEDLADAFFERLEIIELPPPGTAPGLRVWRESGLAVRLLRNSQTWLAARDAIDRESFKEAIRRAARAMPRASYPDPKIQLIPWREPPSAPEIQEFPALFQRCLRSHKVQQPVQLNIRRHRRALRIVGVDLASSTERETFYSLEATAEWGRFGTLCGQLEELVAEQLAGSVARAMRAQGTPSAAGWNGGVVLGASATAVLLHEAVAHALETDILARGGHPEAAIGVAMGSDLLNVFDDPANAPKGVKRRSDDEGFPVLRRCLLRQGKVEQPICDGAWSRRSDILVPGCGRRGNRHDVPGPRSYHLELVPGTSTATDLMAGEGLYFPEAEWGRLNPLTGNFTLRFPYGHRIQDHAPGPMVGPCSIHGHVSDILGAVAAVGRELRTAGAGWCAKDGIKMPVWATSPELRIEGIEVMA